MIDHIYLINSHKTPKIWGLNSFWVDKHDHSLSRCPRGERPLLQLYLEPGVFFRTMHGKTAPSC